MAPLRRRLSVAVGFGETHFACLKRSCTRWHLRRASRLSRRSYIFYFETAFSSARAWSIWSYAYVDDLGGGHRLALAGKRFVGLVAEDFAEVCNRGVDLGEWPMR